jgi:hypothetical protein
MRRSPPWSQTGLISVLNRRRLQETIATDTFFAHTRDISGSLCAQVFYGINSHYINVYGLRTESDGPTAFEDFLRQEGIPSILRSDNSRMQRWGTRITTIVRRHLIGTQFTEPHHPQQNPAELRAIRWLKQSVRLLRMRTGAPSTVWLYAARYMADIHNITSDETLGWSTPWSRRKGGTPDISVFLQFRFYEPVYFHNPQGKFPDTRELPGYWLGVTHNIGNTMFFYVLNADTHRVIERSVLRSALSTRHQNKETKFPDDQYSQDFDGTTSETPSVDSSSGSSHLDTTRAPHAPVAQVLHRRSPRLINANLRDSIQDTPVDALPSAAPRPVAASIRHPPPPDPVTTPTVHEIEESQPLHTYQPNPLETVYAHHGRRHRDLQLIPTSSPFDAPPPELLRSRRNTTRVHLTDRLGEALGTPLFLVNNHPVNHIPQVPTPFIPHVPQFSGFHSLTHPQRTQLEYLQDMDSFADQDDTDSQLWTPSRIISHKIFQPAFQLRYYVAWEWNDTDGTWVDGDALWLQCPDLVLTYVTTHHLSANPSFLWLRNTHTTNANLAHVYKANADPKAPNFKFGEEVPRSVKHALLLDTTNGYSYDDSW